LADLDDEGVFHMGFIEHQGSGLRFRLLTRLPSEFACSLTDYARSELLQGSPARHPIIKAPTTSPPLAQPQPKPMISNLLGQPDFPLAPGTVPTAANPASIFSSDSINLEYAMLSNMLSQQGFQLPATGGTSAPTLAAPAPIPAVARTSGSTPNLTRPPSTAPQALAAYQQITKPYDYRQGFHYLVHHLKSRMAKPDIMRICRALAHFRPSFMAQIMNLSEEDLVFMEKCFQRTLVEYEKLINCSGTPTVVWRRTGEVALVGKEFSLLTGWSREQLLGKKTYIYEVGPTRVVDVPDGPFIFRFSPVCSTADGHGICSRLLGEILSHCL